MKPPPRQPSDIVLASSVGGPGFNTSHTEHRPVILSSASAGGPGFNPQSRTASYQRRYKNGTRQCPCLALNVQKEKILALSQELKKINVMDKIWYRKSQVFGRCGGDEKNE